MALSDADVKKQINHMMAFIDLEANEKAEEIDAKAEEEFNIEKGRLVQQQRVRIMEYYEKKEKQIELQKKIQRSNMLNQARLKVLKSQEDHVKMILDDTKKKLGSVTNNPDKYRYVLQNLICQGLFQLLEPTVVLRCRVEDVQIVESALPATIAQYHQATKKEVKISLDTQSYLDADSAGGVEMFTPNNKIRLDCTLEKRLEMISHQLIPEIRTMLFGPNENRKFMD